VSREIMAITLTAAPIPIPALPLVFKEDILLFFTGPKIADGVDEGAADEGVEEEAKKDVEMEEAEEAEEKSDPGEDKKDDGTLDVVATADLSDSGGGA
jgi:hypothetical protein